MNPNYAYRLKLAQGFLEETYQDIQLRRWRSAMDNAQLVVENAAKSVLALFGPIGRTHYPTSLLRQLLINKMTTNLPLDQIKRLAEVAELLGPDIHIQTDYGDETLRLTPWELFSEADATQALALAEESLNLVQSIYQQLIEEDTL